MQNNIQTPTEKLLSPSMLNRLSDSEATRKVIPAEDRQEAAREIGHAAAHDLPLPGEQATLRFPDGTEQNMTVTGYSRDLAQVDIPTTPGNSVSSNVHLGAFEELTRQTRTK